MLKEQLSLFTADKHMSLAEAMQKIDDNSKGILFVVEEDSILCGVISDGDVRRWILRAGSIETEIRKLMNVHPLAMHNGAVSEPYHYMKEKCITALPIVDEDNKIKDILFAEENESAISSGKDRLEGVSVIVMAGGKGTRLYPYTKILPKPLIPIGDIPIVERIINCFCDYGITDFLLTVNYKKNMIRSYFSDVEKNYEIEYVEEDKPLGTAGSICLIEREFDRPFFVTNCDILIRADYSAIYRYHKESGDAITIVAAMKNDVIPYGVIKSKENGEVESMQEKPRRSYCINTGMYIINPEIIGIIPKDTFFHMTHLTEKAIENGYRVGMYPISEDSFLDMGEIEEMKRMEEKLKIKD